jgi:hypothetical protein
MISNTTDPPSNLKVGARPACTWLSPGGQPTNADPGRRQNSDSKSLSGSMQPRGNGHATFTHMEVCDGICSLGNEPRAMHFKDVCRFLACLHILPVFWRHLPSLQPIPLNHCSAANFSPVCRNTTDGIMLSCTRVRTRRILDFPSSTTRI